MWATKNFDPPGIVPKCLQIHWFIPSNPRCRCIKHPCSMIPIMWFHSVSSPRTNNEKHGFRGCCFRALHGFQGNLVRFAKSHGRHSRFPAVQTCDATTAARKCKRWQTKWNPPCGSWAVSRELFAPEVGQHESKPKTCHFLRGMNIQLYWCENKATIVLTCFNP